jgi:hypothetical protein
MLGLTLIATQDSDCIEYVDDYCCSAALDKESSLFSVLSVSYQSILVV